PRPPIRRPYTAAAQTRHRRGRRKRNYSARGRRAVSARTHFGDLAEPWIQRDHRGQRRRRRHFEHGTQPPSRSAYHGRGDAGTEWTRDNTVTSLANAFAQGPLHIGIYRQ